MKELNIDTKTKLKFSVKDLEIAIIVIATSILPDIGIFQFILPLLLILTYILLSNKNISISKFDFIWFIFILYLFIRNSFSNIQSIGYFISFSWLYGYILFKFCSFYCNSKKVIKGIKISILVSSITVIVQILLQYIYYESSNFPTLINKNIQFINFNSNYITTYLSCIFPIIFIKSGSKRLNYINFAFAVPIVYIILTGISQTSIIALLFSSLVIAIYQNKSRFSLTKSLIFSFVILVVLILSNVVFNLILNQNIPLINEYYGLGPRYRMWESAISLFSSYPIFGVGSANWEFLSDHSNTVFTHPHNIYLQALCELGIIGFGLLLASLFWPMLSEIIKIFKGKNNTLISVSFLSFLFCANLYGVIFPEYLKYCSILFMILILLSNVYKPKQSDSKFYTKLILSFCIISTIYFSYICIKLIQYSSSKKLAQVERLDYLEDLFNPYLFTHLHFGKNISQDIIRLSTSLNRSKIKIKHLNNVLKFEPNNYENLDQLYVEYFKTHDYSNALIIKNYLYSKDTSNLKTLLELAILHSKTGNRNEALNYITMIKNVKIPNLEDSNMTMINELIEIKSSANELYLKIRSGQN